MYRRPSFPSINFTLNKHPKSCSDAAPELDDTTTNAPEPSSGSNTKSHSATSLTVARSCVMRCVKINSPDLRKSTSTNPSWPRMTPSTSSRPSVGASSVGASRAACSAAPDPPLEAAALLVCRRNKRDRSANDVAASPVRAIQPEATDQIRMLRGCCCPDQKRLRSGVAGM